ncbi:MAG TPA: DUF2269 family protein [Gaiellaceae bacterium]|nr:DUF2269 family protein [Gaiellaceae bacterium]
MYEWALFLHLAGGICFFAGLAVATVGQLAARGRQRPGEIAVLLRAARRGVLLVGAGTVAAVASGLWLLDLTAYGAESWVLASLGLLVFAALAGAVGGQSSKRARRLAEALGREGDRPTEELHDLLRRPLADALNLAAGAAAAAILVLMVWKPG